MDPSPLRSLIGRLWPWSCLRPREISPHGWSVTLESYPFLGWRSPDEVSELRRMCSAFLAAKEFSGAQGFVVTDQVALAVAAQACLPVLRLGLQCYAGFVGIVMHEGPVLAQREVVDEAGIVHTWEESLVGESMAGGPVMLSWCEGVAAGSAGQGTAFNVVIHEFVHILDGLDGAMDGIPALSAQKRGRWQQVLGQCFDRFNERSVCGYESVIDDYAAHDPVEFYAVTSEAFFTRPRRFRDEQPELYEIYRDFYRQDPASWQPPDD